MTGGSVARVLLQDLFGRCLCRIDPVGAYIGRGEVAKAFEPFRFLSRKLSLRDGCSGSLSAERFALEMAAAPSEAAERQPAGRGQQETSSPCGQ